MHLSLLTLSHSFLPLSSASLSSPPTSTLARGNFRFLSPLFMPILVTFSTCSAEWKCWFLNGFLDDFCNNFYGVLMGRVWGTWWKLENWFLDEFLWRGILVRNFNCRFRTIGEVFDKMEVRFGFLGLIRVDWYAWNCWASIGTRFPYFCKNKLVFC